VERLGPDRWRFTVAAETPARLVELESNHKMLWSDDYFPLVNGHDKVIEAALLERTGPEPVRMTTGVLGSGEVVTVALE